MKKFEEGDIFINRIKAYPKIKLVGYDGSIYINNETTTQIKLSDFLPEPPPPPPPTEAPAITASNTYITSIEYDIYPIDFSSIPSGNGYVLFQVNPSLYDGIQVIFRRDDTNPVVTAIVFDYGSPGPAPSYIINPGSSLVFVSDSVEWVLQ